MRKFLIILSLFLFAAGYSQSTDNFNSYANGSYLEDAANWDEENVNNGMKVIKPASDGRIAACAPSGYETSVYHNGTYSDDQYSQAKFISIQTGFAIGVSVRNSTTGARDYYGFYTGQSQSYLYKVDNNVYTTLAIGTAWTANDVVRLEVEGNELRCYRNGSLDVSISGDGKLADASFSTGKPGVSGYGNSAITLIDDWEGGDIYAGGPAYNPTQFHLKYKGIEYAPRYGSVLYYAKYGPLTYPAPESIASGFDSTFILSCKEYYLIPENIDNGDLVGPWRKTWSYMTVNPVTYALLVNFNAVFAIGETSGNITIANAAPIDGKIVTADTAINLIIRTFDGVLYEDDTAQVWVKENSKCVFLDYSQGVNGSGSRASPEKDISDVTVTMGYGYFFKCGNIIRNEETVYIDNHINAAAHPTQFGSYGYGAYPRFRSTASSVAFYLGTYVNAAPWYDTDPNHRAEHVYWYNIQFENYYTGVVHSWIPSCNFGWYNCTFNNCNRQGDYVVIHVNDMSYVDSAAVRPFTFVNCRFDTTAILQTVQNANSTYIKMGAGPTKIINCYFGPSKSNYPLFAARLTNGKGSEVRYCHFEPQSTYHESNAGCLQVRSKNTLIEGNIFKGSANGIFITGYSFENLSPDNLTIRNNHFLGNTSRGIFFTQPGISYFAFNDNVIEDNYFNNPTTNAIFIRDLRDNIIRRNIFKGGQDAIYSSTTEASNGVDIYYNLFYGQSSNSLEFTAGTDITIYNNTVDGNIVVPQTAQFTVKNCFWRSTTVDNGNNIDMDEYTFGNYFNADYSLKVTALEAIDLGAELGFTIDLVGNTVPQGAGPDIGAYEFIP